MDTKEFLVAEFPSPAISECPYPYYQALRDDAPVHRLPTGTWLITRWEDVMEVVRDTETFSSEIAPRNPQILGGALLGGDDSGPWPLPFTNDPQHKTQRTLARSIVSQARLRWFEPIIARLTDELVDAFEGAGRADFRTDLAEPLPRRVMMEAFGFPRADEDEIIRFTTGPDVGSKLSSARAAGLPEDAVAREKKLRVDLGEYIRERVETFHREPQDNFLSELVHAQIERDGEIDVPYLVAECAGLFSGGFLTTAHMLANTMLLLLTHPETMDRVRADRSLLRVTVEESVRTESPVQFLQRIATRDVTLQGETIPAGSTVLVGYGSANRDERKWEAPDEFRIDRRDVVRNQLGFGFGTHTCVGAPLARQEAQIVFNRIFDRLENLALDTDPEAITHVPRSLNQRTAQTVPFTFTVIGR